MSDSIDLKIGNLEAFNKKLQKKLDTTRLKSM